MIKFRSTISNFANRQRTSGSRGGLAQHATQMFRIRPEDSTSAPPEYRSRASTWVASRYLLKSLLVFLALEGAYRFFTGTSILLRDIALRKSAGRASILFAVLELPLATFGLYVANQHSRSITMARILTLGIISLSIVILPVLFLSVQSAGRIASLLSAKCTLEPPFYNEFVTREEAIRICQQRVANVMIANYFLDVVRLLMQVLMVRVSLLWQKSITLQIDEEITLANDSLNLQPHTGYDYTPNPLLRGQYPIAASIIAVPTSGLVQSAPPYREHEYRVPGPSQAAQQVEGDMGPRDHLDRAQTHEHELASKGLGADVEGAKTQNR